jgi:error-prone DNA polymerase
MGFYAPAQIVRDVREHGVAVREVDVNHSEWDCTLEEGTLRLGLRQIDGLQREVADRLADRRPCRTVEEPRTRSARWDSTGVRRCGIRAP